MKNIPKLIVLIGISGSGKSTIAKQYAFTDNEREHIVVSSDAIRGELYGDENCQKDHAKVFEIAHNRLIQGLKDGYNVIFDATNITMKFRKALLDKIKNIDCWKVAHVIPCPIEECIERDSKRNRKVGKEVIEKQMRQFQIPHYFEGFDEIKIEGWDKIEFNKIGHIRIRKLMNNFEQKTPYHKYVLRKHCDETEIYIIEHYKENKNIFALLGAAMWHDFGKLFSQAFDEKGQAHYYNHENIGVYKLLTNLEVFWGYDNKQVIDILALINYHMFPFNWKEQKTHDKYKELFGEELYNNLMILHKADKFASGTYNNEVENND